MTKLTGEAKRKQHLDALAHHLVARHLRLSVPDRGVRVDLAALHGKRYPSEDVERNTRCIAIVGAGASAPLLARADDLATSLEQEFGRDEEELERLELVFRLPREEFETRLVALSAKPEVARKVRSAISRSYGNRHPTVLGYELLAHLLKHRFVDAIISFNFDELLDQSLEDELGGGEYLPIISERDCRGIRTNPDDPGYTPLYVKLHGTASEPESLRFTLDQYYSLPTAIAGVASDLLDTDSCVILNVGSGLGSFDIERLLGLPKHLEVFDLGVKPKKQPEQEVTHRRPRTSRKDREKAAQARITQDRRKAHRSTRFYDCRDRESPSAPKTRPSCSAVLQRLTDAIAEEAQRMDQIFRFRSVQRHIVVSKLLGPPESDPEDGDEAPPADSPSELLNYLRRRTILELAFSGAKARGLLSLGPLALDRPARYFEQYQRLAGCGQSEWIALCKAAGLDEGILLPDVLVASRHLRAKSNSTRNSKARETLQLHDYEPDRHARQVLAHVNPIVDDPEARRSDLADVIEDLQRKPDVEIHVNDDRVCSKAFKRPVRLLTSTSMQAYTTLMLRDLKKTDEVLLISETGKWLLGGNAPTVERAKIRILVAFDDGLADLDDRYGRRLRARTLDPWWHNRHMCVVIRDHGARAVYFARRLRSQIITPVYLDDEQDVGRLERVFNAQWNKNSKKWKRPGDTSR